MTIVVRRVQPGDAEKLFQLRRDALIQEPFAFLSSPEDDLASSPDVMRDQLSTRSERSAVIGAFSGDELIGMAGITQDQPIKAAHRACIWGVFVKPQYRGQGVGSRMLEATLSHARAMEGIETVYLSVSEKTPNAKHLYESAGFVVWGVEPDCIRYEGTSAQEYHLWRAL